MTPMPTQISGAHFLASRQRAFLWDQPRVGKTGATIIAADLILARTILVITTASGRGVWRQAFPAWSAIPRRVRVLGSDPSGKTDVGIVSWGQLSAIPASIGSARPDLIILDEHHRACNPEAQRTQHTYGRMIGSGGSMDVTRAIVQPGDRVWQLSGTPAPHDPGNLWAPMRATCPERLQATRTWPDVTSYDAFRARYCVMGVKKLAYRRIPVVLGGKNEAELRQRLEGTFLRRTQAQVGIRSPRYEMLPLIVGAEQRRQIANVSNEAAILAAADAGNTHELEMELGRLRHITGVIKAHAVVEAVKEEFGNGLAKLVLAYWHRDVGDTLADKLAGMGIVRLDGATSPRERETVEQRFRDPTNRIFLVQIEAGCEAIDLSPSDELWVVEYATSPRQMDQISKRITNVGKQRNCFIRACAIEGSIDEKLQATLVRLWNSIREVIRS